MNPEAILPYLAGPVAGLIVSLIWNWYQAKEKCRFLDIIAGKDDDIKNLTSAAIAGITTLSGLNQQNQKWQEATTATLEKIKKALP